MSYEEIIRAIKKLPLEDKEAMQEDLQILIDMDVEESFYNDDPYNEHRKQDLENIILEQNTQYA